MGITAWTPDRRKVLTAGGLVVAGGLAATALPASAASSGTPALPPPPPGPAPFEIAGLARVNGIFGDARGLFLTAATDDGRPALLSRPTGDGQPWQPLAGPADAATLADGTRLTDGRLLLVGSTTSRRPVDMSAMATGVPGAETYLSELTQVHPAAWLGSPETGWQALALPEAAPQALLTGVASNGRGVVAVGHVLDREGVTGIGSFSLATTEPPAAWTLGTFPGPPSAEGGINDVVWRGDRWLTVGFDLNQSAAYSSPDGVVWFGATVGDSVDPGAQVGELSVAGGRTVVLSGRRSDPAGSDRVQSEDQPEPTARSTSARPVFSQHATSDSTVVVASAADGRVTLEEVSLARD